jgi:Rrf2 family iron-sulfur cluster assembly transcriptional regulator
MKISSQEEYGLRILIRIAKKQDKTGLTISHLSREEGLTVPYIGKITRILRLAGFIKSTRGNRGGYVLSKPASQIKINDVLKSLGGPLFDQTFCDAHAGKFKLCTNSMDCSIRSLWKLIQFSVNSTLNKLTLSDLLGSEDEIYDSFSRVKEEMVLST